MPLVTDGDVLTYQGLDLVAKLVKGDSTLRITRASVGDGVLPEGTTKPMIRNYKELIHEIHPAQIIRKQHTGNGESLIELMVSSDGVEVGFHVTELAIFAEDPDSKEEVLYTYVSLHEDPQWIRPEGAAVGKVARYTIILKVGDVEHVEVHFTPGSMVTREEMEDHNDSDESHNGHFTNKEIHVTLAEKEEFRSAGIPFTVTLSKNSWSRVGNSFRQEIVLSPSIGVRILSNMRPMIAADADTIAQMVDGDITIQACNERGKLFFYAIGVIPNIDLLVQVVLIKLKQSEEGTEPHNSEPIGSTNGLGTPLPLPVTPSTITLTNTSSHSELSVTSSWTNPSQDCEGVLILRKEGSLMPSSISDGTVIKNGKVTGFTDKDRLEVGKTYTYRWIPYNSVGNYQMSAVVKQVTITAVTPLAPTNVQLSNSTAADAFAVNISWSAPTDVYREKFAVVRKTGSSPTSLTDGKIIYQGTGTSVRDKDSLTYDVAYFYSVFAVNSSGASSAAAVSSAKSITIVPSIPQQVSNLKLEDASANTVGYRVRVSCDFPKDVNAYQWTVIRKLGSNPTSSVDGIKVHEDRVSGGSDSFIDAVDYSAQSYFYRVFIVNQKGQLSTSEASKSVTLTVGRPGNITNLSATDERGTTTVQFDLPTVLINGSEILDKYCTGYRVIQKVGSAPTSASDGTVISDGSIAPGATQKRITCQRSGQPNGSNIYIVVFTKSHAGTYFLSFGQTVNVTPVAIPTFRYNGQYELLKDDEAKGKWRIKFKTSGTFVLLSPDTLDVDVFLVGGGGGGTYGGGGGGYTKTFRKVRIQKNIDIPVLIGSGGGINSNGGNTSFQDMSAGGGKHAGVNIHGYLAGGDGGCGGGGVTYNPGDFAKGLDGGSNGANGQGGYNTYGGIGQVTTTREFEEPDGEVYSGGGGGNSGAGGFGGFGGGAKAQAAVNGIGGQPGQTRSKWQEGVMGGPAFTAYSYGGGGGGGYGGGGGGGLELVEVIGGYPGGAGFQGIAIIRDAR